MKKHIIVAGVPRAGKSTVSKMIAHQLGYQHVSMDSVIAGIEKIFPETKIDTHAQTTSIENLKFMSSKITPFIQAMIESGEYDECDYGMVIDIFQILPEDYVRYIDPEKCDIFYFITSNVTSQERFEILKEYDTPDDYTYFYSDAENQKDCEEIVEVSQMIRSQCMLYELPYYETAYEREQVLQNFIARLKEES